MARNESTVEWNNKHNFASVAWHSSEYIPFSGSSSNCVDLEALIEENRKLVLF